MPSNRSVAYINDGVAKVTICYKKFDYANSVWYDNTKITAVSIIIYNDETSAVLQASTAMTYDATIQAYRYLWTYVGSARRVRAVMVPTLAVGVPTALAPPSDETIDLADTLHRIDTDVSAAQTAIITEVDAKAAEMEGVGFTTADTLHQAKLQRDTTQNAISALDLRTSTNFLMPSFMAQNKTYTVYLRIRDDAGNLVDADATPTLTTLEGGALDSNITVGSFTRDSLGQYHASIAVGASTPAKYAFNPRAFWDRTEGSIVNHEDAVRNVTVDSFESDTSQILTIVTDIQAHANNGTYGFAALQVIAADIQAKVNNGTYGLVALRADIDAVATQVGVDGANVSLQTKLGAFTAMVNLFAMLGAFTNVETVLLNIQRIQGMLPP